MVDLYIKNGKTVSGDKIELTIQAGKILEVAEELQDIEATEVIDLAGESYLSAGWIDDHVHCFEKMTLYYDYPDEIGVPKGVTTVIDAGTTGAENIGEFYELAKNAETNVFALVNISKWGIVEQDELADLKKIKEDLITEALAKYPDFIVGIKARMSRTVVGDNDIIPLDLAKKIQADNHHLPLMVHIGSAPPTLDKVLADMEKGDVLTHCYNGKPNGILDEQGEIKDFVWDAYRRGIIFDIGHGTDSFNFKVAEKAKAEGLVCETISTDIYHHNREAGPVYDMATTLEKMLVLGYSLEEILPMITENPAAAFHLTNKGQLKAGFDGDVTIFKVAKADKTLTDSNGFTRETHEEILPTYAIVGGKVHPIKGE
ncbi:amidohydrolase/deacetylase family metallohydrolase [Carnobacterium gallinarum]|uniref:amidohydrolase/deacetylase family metallohydrolase n=1 Tax=Carnobacterium gallinarum TaxID=2749 RepID=UPI000551D4AF|nr:amidohydrolase/deacetylase family metallohydrolase [Carnobacterium gallinarum]